MKNLNSMKVLTVILMGIIILCVATTSFAAQSITSIQASTGNNTTDGSVNNLANDVPTNNTANNTLEDNTLSNSLETNNVVENDTSGTLPDTGAKLSIGLISLIALTSISAVYTYINVKKYNI